MSLPGSPVAGVPGNEVEILGALPCSERAVSLWRTIDLFSEQNTPWEARLKWSGGQAGSRTVYVTVAKGTRISLHAASVYVTGKALGPNPVTAWAAISDGNVSTENEYSVRGSCTVGVTTAQVALPPFAKYVRLELSDVTLYSGSLVRLYDGWNTKRCELAGDKQPNPGIPVGDSALVEIVVPSAVDYRITFMLSL